MSPELLGRCVRRLSVLVDRALGPCRGDLPSWRCRQPILEECIRQQVRSRCVCAGVWCPHRGCSWEEIFVHGWVCGLGAAQKHYSCFNALLCPGAVRAWGKFRVQSYCRLCYSLKAVKVVEHPLQNRLGQRAHRGDRKG